MIEQQKEKLKQLKEKFGIDTKGVIIIENNGDIVKITFNECVFKEDFNIDDLCHIFNNYKQIIVYINNTTFEQSVSYEFKLDNININIYVGCNENITIPNNKNITNHFKGEVNLFNINLNINNACFYKKINVNLLENKNIMISNSDFKSEIFISSNTGKENNIDINESLFSKTVEFNEIKARKFNIDNTKFNNLVKFYKLTCVGNFKIANSIFRNNVIFLNSKFEELFYTYNTRINKSFDLLSSNTKYTPCFAKTIFFEPKSIYLNHNNIDNAIDTIEKYKKILEELTTDEIEKAFNNYKPQTPYILIREAFVNIKNVCIVQNNNIEASKYQKLELYTLELEEKLYLKPNMQKNIYINDYKFKQDIKMPNFTLAHLFSWLQLVIYRKTSDHHSDLSKIFFFTLSVLGLYMFLVSLLAFIIDGYVTSFNFTLFDENIFQLIVKVFDSINLSFMSSILMKLCAVVIAIVVLLAMSCLVDLIKVKISCQGSIFLKTLVDLTTQHLTTITLMVLIAFVALMCIFSHFNLLINLVLYCILFIFLMVFLINLNLNVLIAIGSFGVLCFIYQPSIAAPFLGIVSDNAKNYNLIKSIHDLNNNETNELYSLFVGRNIQANEILYLDSSNGIYSIQHKSNDLNNKNLKQVLLEHKDIIKEYILKDVYKGVKNSSIAQIQKSVAKDQIMQSINAIYYIVLFLCLFSLQKTARRNSIVPN